MELTQRASKALDIAMCQALANLCNDEHEECPVVGDTIESCPFEAGQRGNCGYIRMEDWLTVLEEE